MSFVPAQIPGPVDTPYGRLVVRPSSEGGGVFWLRLPTASAINRAFMLAFAINVCPLDILSLLYEVLINV